jgi:tyrosine-protein kinase Etk/Wzc
MEFVDYWRIFLRYKWLIIFSFVIVVVAVSINVYSVKPVFESECKLLLIDNREKNSLTEFTPDDIMMQTLGKADDPVLSKIEILKTRPIIEETIKRCNILNKENQLIGYDDFQKRFKFDYIKETNIIRIIYKDHDRENAPRVANMLATVFTEQNQKMNQEKIRNAKDFIEHRIAIQKNKVEEAEMMVMNFKAKTRTASFDKKMSVQVNTIADLETERIRLVAELKGVKAQRSEIESRLNQTGSQVAPYYSSMVISKEQGTIAASNLDARIRAIDDELNIQYKIMKNLPALEIHLSRLTREEKLMNDIYTSLLAKYEEYTIKEAAQVSSIKIIEPSTIPIYPVFPKKKNSIALAGLTGLFLGIGLTFFVEFLRDRPQSVDEVKKILETNSLGSIPIFKSNSLLFTIDSPSSLPSDAIRLIYANLRFKDIMHKEHITFMITSAEPGEGKTTITANMAVAFANSGKRTALVSLDLRHPAFDKLFEREFKKGLVDYLIGEARFEQIAYKLDANSLTIIPGGQIPPNPSELIGSQKMIELVNQLRSSFDVVLFDTAPITMVAEPLVIARNMDGIILVVNHSVTSRKSLQEMHDILQGKELPILGVVINKVRKELFNKYGYYEYKKVKVS